MAIVRRQSSISILISVGLLGASLLLRNAAAQTQPIIQIPPIPPAPSFEPMSDTLRSAVKQLVVIANDKAARESITGTYERATPGFAGGVNEGANLGSISTQVGGVNVSVPVPVLMIPGAVYGGLSGSMKRQIQEFRDGLTEELAHAESHPLRNDSLALDVYYNLAALPQLDTKLIAPSVAVPEATDAVLHVGFSELGIHVEDEEAILTLSATAELQRRSDGAILYKRMMQYVDRATLANWTSDDRALWKDYANFAAHYLGRALAAETFGRVLVADELVPEASGTLHMDRKDANLFHAETATPELAWKFALRDEVAGSGATQRAAGSAVSYDVEIYDQHRLVYSRTRLPEPRHVIAEELQPCASYRWSVRPVFDDGTTITYGDWMRLGSDPEGSQQGRNGLVGRNALIAPAYTQDFPSLQLKCRRR